METSPSLTLAIIEVMAIFGVFYAIFKLYINKIFINIKESTIGLKLIYCLFILSALNLGVSTGKLIPELYWSGSLKIESLYRLTLTGIIPFATLIIINNLFFKKTQSSKSNNFKENKSEFKTESFSEKQIEEAYLEIDSEKLNKGLWAKSLIDSNGNENLAKTLYMKETLLRKNPASNNQDVSIVKNNNTETKNENLEISIQDLIKTKKFKSIRHKKILIIAFQDGRAAIDYNSDTYLVFDSLPHAKYSIDNNTFQSEYPNGILFKIKKLTMEII